MKLNRNHYFFAGVFLLLLGLEFRMVETFVLNQQASQVVAQQLGTPGEQRALGLTAWLPNSTPAQSLRSFTPPKAVGWAMLALGGILVLHAIALQKPEEAKPAK